VAERLGAGGIDEHRLAEPRQVDVARAVLVPLPDHLRPPARHRAGQERRDVELLPGGEVFPDRDRDLGVEPHGLILPGPAPAVLNARAAGRYRKGKAGLAPGREWMGGIGLVTLLALRRRAAAGDVCPLPAACLPPAQP